MKVLISGTLAASDGGPAMSIYYTLKGLRNLGVDATVIQYPLRKGDTMRGEDIPSIFYRKPLFKKLGFATDMADDINQVDNVDIYHAQGIWQWNTYSIVDVAQKHGKPYLITPRGMLYPQDIAKSNTIFKRFSLKWRLLDDLNGAACVHVTCEDEMLHCRNLGVTAPIAIIPNPVEIKDYPLKKIDDIRRIGYLGRISRRKNIEGLIKAFHTLGEEAKEAELLIIGGGDVEYKQYLHHLVEEYKLGNVRFAGFLSGEEKDRALASCSVLAMPSEFENLGNVVLEGLVRGIPCIATTGSPWRELQTHRCGWWVPYSQQDITDAVYSVFQTSQEELQTMGANGRRLMEENYGVDRIGQKMKALYEWVLGKGDSPEFVFTNKI